MVTYYKLQLIQVFRAILKTHGVILMIPRLILDSSPDFNHAPNLVIHYILLKNCMNYHIYI